MPSLQQAGRTPPKHGLFTLWAARVGPYNSPYEGHDYFETLPFCHFVDGNSSFVQARPPARLGELMGGYSWNAFANLELPELPPPGDPSKEGTPILREEFKCTTKAITKEEALALSQAVEHRWFYEMFLTDLPVWGMVGEMLPTILQPHQLSAHLYTKTHLMVYLNPHILKVDLTSDPSRMVLVEPNKSYDYQLTIDYAPVYYGPALSSKYDRYVDHNFFQNETRSFGAINSSVIAFFILGLLSLFVRKVWKHNNNKDENKTGGDPEQGNTDATKALLPNQEQQHNSKKLDPTQVFGVPHRFELLAALLGNGWHLYVWAFFVSWWMKDKNPLEFGFGGRWEILIYGYAATSMVAGYVSSFSFWQQQKLSEDVQTKQAWRRVVVGTALLLPVCALTFASTLFAADALLSSTPNIDQISFQGVQRLFLLWAGVALPSQVLGAFLGKWHQGLSCAASIDSFLILSMPPFKNKAGKCVNQKIVSKPSCWALIYGILCFGTIFIDQFFLMTALWRYKFYITTWANLASLMLLFFTAGGSSAIITLLILSSAIEEANVESWQWNAFFASASTGIYSFAYSIYYYFSKSSLEGWYTLLHYFGTMLLLSTGLALMCGAMGHFVAYQSVRFLYSNIKAA